MSDEKLREELYQKLEQEYNHFIEELKTLPAEKIIDKSYEKVTKEEFKETFYPDSKKFDIEDIKRLSKESDVLATLYDRWLDADGGYHEMLEYCAYDFLEELEEKEEKEKPKKKEREER